MTTTPFSGLEQFIELLPDIAMIIDTDGRILHHNHAAAALFPVVDSWLKAIPDSMDWPFQTEEPLEIMLIVPDGTSREFQVQISDAMRIGCDGYLTLLQDLTERNKQDQEREAVLAISDAFAWNVYPNSNLHHNSK